MSPNFSGKIEPGRKEIYPPLSLDALGPIEKVSIPHHVMLINHTTPTDLRVVP